MVLAWKSWKVWAGTPDPVGPVCLDPPPPPPRFAPPPDTRPGLAPPSLQKEEEEAVELLVEEPTLSIGMTVFYYRQGLKIMLWQWMERLWWRCGAGVRTLKLVSLYLPQVEHRCRHVHNIMGLKIQVINNDIRNFDVTHQMLHHILLDLRFYILYNSLFLMEGDRSVWKKIMSAAKAGLPEKQLISALTRI